MLYKTLFLFSPDEPVINTLPASSGRIANVNDVFGIVDEKALLVGLGDSATQTVEGSIDVTGSLYEDGVSVLTESNVTTSITEDSSDVPTSGAVYDELQNYATKEELPIVPESLKSPYSITFKGNNENITSYDGSTQKSIDFSASQTNGAFIVSDGTTTKTIRLAGTFTDTNYYPTSFSWTDGTTSGPTGTLSMSGTSNVSFGAMPVASSSTSGVVTTNAQIFAGQKTFSDSPIMTNHIVVYGDDDDSLASKPTNQTGITGDLDATYWNTGISAYDADTEVGYQYSFPAHSGTFVTTAGGTMDDDAVVGFKSANDNDTAHIDSDGFTASTRTGTTSSNWSSTATSYAYDAINIERKGKRTGPNHQVTEWDYIYKLNLPLEGRIVESGDTGATLLTDESLKTINGQSLVGSGDITIDGDTTPQRTLNSKYSKTFFDSLDEQIQSGDIIIGQSTADDIEILDDTTVEQGIAVCRFGYQRTYNPMKNGHQQRKGWFIEPNICKRGRYNVTGFSADGNAGRTSFTVNDLVYSVIDHFYINRDGANTIVSATPTLKLTSIRTLPKDFDSMKKGYANASEMVFEIVGEDTSALVRPIILHSVENHVTFANYRTRSNIVSPTNNKVIAYTYFNLLIGDWGTKYVDTSQTVGYHPRCTYTKAMKVFIALKTPVSSGSPWRLIVQFATAK